MRLSYKILAVAAYSATLAFAQVIKVRGFDACGRTLFFKALHHLGCYIHTRALYGVCEKLEIYPTVFGSLKP